MDRDKFSAILSLIVPQVVQLIVEKNGIDETAATQAFYNSKVYRALENVDTAVWHFSALTLYNMYKEEKETGSFVFPKEAA